MVVIGGREMAKSSRPILALYVVWHPDFKAGTKLARQLLVHYRRDLYSNAGGSTGLSVLYRSEVVPGSTFPIPIPLDESETTIIVVLAESNLCDDPNWVAYVRDLSEKTDAVGFRTRLLVVALDKSFHKLGITDQALRFDGWGGYGLEFSVKQLAELTYEICRVLRHFLQYLDRPGTPDGELESYLTQIRVFISHSKHDDHGRDAASAIRDQLHRANGLESFFDVHNIPAGVKFDRTIFLRVRTSIVIAVHSDSYSSREWCRKEVLEAKRSNVPLIVANCIRHIDDRGFPYLGNVPIVRMDVPTPDRIDYVIGRLFDEVLKDFLWKCRVALCAHASAPGLVFVPRTPELLMLAALPPIGSTGTVLTVIYPDPPMPAEEGEIFDIVSPGVNFSNLSTWLAGVTP